MSEQSHIITRSPNRKPDTISGILKDLLNQGIKPAIEPQSQAFERMVTQKLITTLSTITFNQDRNFEDLR